MIDEMTGARGWRLLEQVTAAGRTRPMVLSSASYGEGLAFRLEL